MLFNVWLIFESGFTDADPPVMAPAGLLTGFNQLYKVPVGTISPPVLFCPVHSKTDPVHNVMVLSEMTGRDCRLMVRRKGVPGQPAAVGVTV